MRAAQLDAYGPAENLKIVEIPIPEPSDDEVLIKVEAASVIFADTLMRRGDYVNLPSRLPFVPGREVAGTVVKLGANVKDIPLHARVTADMHTGGYAEYAVAAAKNVVLLPHRASFLQGIVYHVNMRIAYLGYYTFGQVSPKASILLHAAAGGIGILLTHIAKRQRNNTVIALASSDEKLEYCRANGADYCINYKTADYVEEVLRITGGEGVDVSLNSVAGPTLRTDPRVIKPLGRWVLYGYAAGRGLIDPYEVMSPRSQTMVIFSVYTVREREEYRRATAFSREWLDREELISVSKSFPLEDVVAAQRWIESQRSYGKIALVM